MRSGEDGGAVNWSQIMSIVLQEGNYRTLPVRGTSVVDDVPNLSPDNHTRRIPKEVNCVLVNIEKTVHEYKGVKVQGEGKSHGLALFWRKDKGRRGASLTILTGIKFLR